MNGDLGRASGERSPPASARNHGGLGDVIYWVGFLDRYAKCRLPALRRDPVPDPARQRDRAVVAAGRADNLQADGHAGGAGVGG